MYRLIMLTIMDFRNLVRVVLNTTWQSLQRNEQLRPASRASIAHFFVMNLRSLPSHVPNVVLLQTSNSDKYLGIIKTHQS